MTTSQLRGAMQTGSGTGDPRCHSPDGESYSRETPRRKSTRRRDTSVSLFPSDSPSRIGSSTRKFGISILPRRSEKPIQARLVRVVLGRSPPRGARGTAWAGGERDQCKKDVAQSDSNRRHRPASLWLLDDRVPGGIHRSAEFSHRLPLRTPPRYPGFFVVFSPSISRN